jgi:hypothetical protein
VLHDLHDGTGGKDALKLYKRELGCSHQEAIEAYCRDWNLSGIDKSLAFAQKVNQAGHVLNLRINNETDFEPAYHGLEKRKRRIKVG